MSARVVIRAAVVLLAALGVGHLPSGSTVAAQGKSAAPAFTVDPLWPRPLPNHWILGSVTGVAVDAQDHVWVVHRGMDSLTARTEAGLGTDPPTAEACCAAAPPVLEFDPAGNLVSHWGGPGQGYEWPQSPAGITIDAKGNVWIVAAGAPPAAGRGGRGGGAAQPTTDEAGNRINTPPATGGGGAAGGGRAAGGGGGQGRGNAPAAPPRPQDAHVLKFTRAGKFLLQIGQAGKTEGGSESKTTLNRPASVEVDSVANEVYVADGYVNHRVVVFDSETGVYKRHWGGSGEKPDDTAPPPYDPNGTAIKGFRTVTCARLSKDGLVYVCDRQNDRVQVFKKDGTLQKEVFVSKTTLGDGSVWDIAFSKDAQQRYLYVADGLDQKVFVLSRDTLQEVGSFGDGGRQPGRFYGVGSVAVDSKGNIYTGETFEGKRVQKWAVKGAR